MRSIDAIRKRGVRVALYVGWLLMGTWIVWMDVVEPLWHRFTSPFELPQLHFEGAFVALLMLYAGQGVWHETVTRRRLARWLPLVVLPAALFGLLLYGSSTVIVEHLLVWSIAPFCVLCLVAMTDASNGGKNSRSSI